VLFSDTATPYIVATVRYGNTLHQYYGATVRYGNTLKQYYGGTVRYGNTLKQYYGGTVRYCNRQFHKTVNVSQQTTVSSSGKNRSETAFVLRS
jgi:hypothetical protein